MKRIELRDVLTIGCYRRGRSSDTSHHPATVLVMVDVNSRKLWKATREVIIKILTEFSLPMVAVEIVKDMPILLYRQETGFKEEVEDSCANPGGPISSLKDKYGCGTLGGFIELQDPKGAWFPFALTCFHVIDPVDEDIVGSDDLEGEY